MADEHPDGAEFVTVRAARRRPRDPRSRGGVYEVADVGHAVTIRTKSPQWLTKARLQWASVRAESPANVDCKNRQTVCSSSATV